MQPDEIARIHEEALAEAREADSADALEAVRLKYLSRKGLVQDIMASLKTAAPADRPAIGQAANRLRAELLDAVNRRREKLAEAAETSGPAFDITLPGRWPGLGSIHPVSGMIAQCADIFRSMGFTVADGPDIETAFHNFDALNHPPGHPARDPRDTFYLEDGTLLRTHTSPVQVRYMQAHPPPVRIIAPGRTYRRDTPDATHSSNFHQIEGLYVADRVSLADLKGDLTYFASQLLGARVQVRFRPHFFPFTEPSVEVDFSCHVCGGQGCRVCKQSGWIEIGGAGMVDPNVYTAVGYDPEAVTGYAFGLGVERMAMIFHGIPDIRLLYENDVRFLAQF